MNVEKKIKEISGNYFSPEDLFRRLKNNRLENLTSKHVLQLFNAFGIPKVGIKKINDYTDCLSDFIYYYILNFDRRKNNFQYLRRWILKCYQQALPVISGIEVFSVLSFLPQISYETFLRVCRSCKADVDLIRDFAFRYKLLKEENGFYYWQEYALEYFVLKRRQTETQEEQRKREASLLNIIIKDELAIPSYINIRGKRYNKKILEKNLERSIATNKNYTSEYGRELKRLTTHDFKDIGLKFFISVLREDFPLNKSALYLIEKLSLEKHLLAPAVRDLLYYQIGKSGKEVTFDLPRTKGIEDQYIEVIARWLKGQRREKDLPLYFYQKYGFTSVPEEMLLNCEDLRRKLLSYKLGDNETERLNARLSLFYFYFIHGDKVMVQELFSSLVREEREFLLKSHRAEYSFVTGCYFYCLNKNKRAKFYLEIMMELLERKNEPIFLLKGYQLYARLMTIEKNIDGLRKLQKRSLKYLPKDLAYQEFLKTLEIDENFLLGNNKKCLKGLKHFISISLERDDKISALKYYFYAMSFKEDEEAIRGKLTDIQEILTPPEKAIVANSLIMGKNQRSNISFKFFDGFNCTIDQKVIGNIFKSRKKARRVLSYIIYKWPKKISKEEMMSVFWDKEKSVDVDVNLRVTMSNMKSILQKASIDDLVYNSNGYFYINPRYDVKSDLSKLFQSYRQGLSLYKEKDYVYAKKVFSVLIGYKEKLLFEDVDEDLENKLRDDCKSMFSNIEIILFKIARNNGDFLAAEKYGKEVIKKDQKYIPEFLDILEKLGNREKEIEALTNFSDKPERTMQEVLAKILVPFSYE